jgi:hypothetical protein
MHSDTKKLLITYLCVIVFIVGICFFARAVAKDAPPAKVYSDRDKIVSIEKKLQKVYQQKTELEGQVKALYDDMANQGWGYDPNSMTFGKLPAPKKLSYDPIKVAKAISCAETSCGKDGTAIHRKNCCGIMTWKTGTRQPKYFPTYEASLKEAAAIWNKSYGKLPDLQLAKKWTGDDHAENWLKTFYTAYNSID